MLGFTFTVCAHVHKYRYMLSIGTSQSIAGKGECKGYQSRSNCVFFLGNFFWPKVSEIPKVAQKEYSLLRNGDKAGLSIWML